MSLKGGRIEELCKLHGLSELGLSKEIGIHRNTLRKMKRGESVLIRPEHLIALADKLCTSADFMLGRDLYCALAPPKLRYWDQLSERDRELVRAMVKCLYLWSHCD